MVICVWALHHIWTCEKEKNPSTSASVCLPVQQKHLRMCMRQETRTTEDLTAAHSAFSSAMSQSSAEPKDVLENCRSGTDKGTDGRTEDWLRARTMLCLSTVTQACSLSTWEAEQEDHTFETSLAYSDFKVSHVCIARLSQNRKNKKVMKKES